MNADGGNKKLHYHFAFHSGTILIRSDDRVGVWDILYIPLWYDSNELISLDTEAYNNFTFHSGTILTTTPYFFDIIKLSLHSTLVRF